MAAERGERGARLPAHRGRQAHHPIACDCVRASAGCEQEGGMNAHITAERVRELFSYDPETGVFRHLRTPWNRRVQAGDAAGFASGPYWTIYADGRTYKAHRL